MQKSAYGSTASRRNVGGPSAADHQAAGLGTASTFVEFRVNPLLFDVLGLKGLAQEALPPQFNVQAVLTITQHTTLKSHLSSSEWLTIAKGITGMSNQTAALLFDTFHAVCETPEVRLEASRTLLGKLQDTSNPSHNLNHAMSQRTVPPTAFTVFLLAQCAWLSASIQNSVVNGELAPEQLATFVKTHMLDFVSAVGVSRPGKASPQEIQDLRHLFVELEHNSASAVPQSVPFGSNVRQWWQRDAPFMDVAGIANYIRQRVVLGVREGMEGAKETRVSDCSAVALVQHPPIPGSSTHLPFVIARNHKANIYCVAPMPSTLITHNTNTQIVMGPVGGLVSIENCEQCSISVVCSALRVANCRTCKIYCCTNTPPMLVGLSDTSGVQLAPYNTFYSTLEEHLLTAGVNPRLSLFQHNLPQAFCLPPAQFAPVTVPFTPLSQQQSSGGPAPTTRTNPCAMPAAYATAVQAKVDQYHAMVKKLHDACEELVAQGRKDLAEVLRSKVQARFQQWMQESGQSHQVLDLLHSQSIALA